MTYHAYVGESEDDVHPEEPDRITGIHKRLQGIFESTMRSMIQRFLTHIALTDAGLLSRMDRIAIREAVKAEATLIHSAELWHKVNSFASTFVRSCFSRAGSADNVILSFSEQPPEFYILNRLFFGRLSLYVNEHSALCARLSLGGVIETCRAVAEGRIANAFAIVRPPGHHAEPEQAMGFCFYVCQRLDCHR
jgi:histone deacetylase 6